jgi:hypothetical protein
MLRLSGSDAERIVVGRLQAPRFEQVDADQQRRRHGAHAPGAEGQRRPGVKLPMLDPA